MASNKGQRGLDKSTRAALSSLEWALEQTAEDELQSDEFTVQQFMDSRASGTYSAAESLLRRMFREGKLTKRKLTINGCIFNAYKKA